MEDGAYPSWQTFEKGFCNTDFLYEPRQIKTGIKYSNLGFNLLGQIVDAYGKLGTQEAYITTKVFDPLNMQNSVYSLSDSPLLSQLATSYGNPGTDILAGDKTRLALPKVLEPESYEGSIGVNSTALDLAKLGQELLSWTTSSQSRILREDALTTILLPKVARKSSMAYSNGLMLYNTKSEDYPFHSEGYLCYGHTGTGYGSRTLLYVCPELQWGFALVTNARNVNREKFMLEVSQIFAEAGQVVNKTEELSKDVASWLSLVRKLQENVVVAQWPKIEKAVGDQIPTHLRDYVGSYRNDVQGLHKITASVNGKLVMWGQELIEISKDHFQFPHHLDYFAAGEPVRFVRDKNGTVVAFHGLHVLHAPKVEEP